MGFKRWWGSHAPGRAAPTALRPDTNDTPSPPPPPGKPEVPATVPDAPEPRATAPREEPDHTFSHLTASQGSCLRALVEHHAGALTGGPVTVHNDHFVDAQGRAHGLWGLSGTCRHTPSTEWSDAIKRSLRDTLMHRDSPPLSSRALADALKLRLMRDASLADVSQLPYCAPIAPGLVEVVTLDLPDRVIVPEWNALSVYGSREGIIHQARQNLAKEAWRTEAESSPTPHGVTITRLAGDPYYTASIAIVIDQLAASLLPPDQPARTTPWLVRIPTYGECFLAPAGQPHDDLTVRALLEEPSSLSTASALMPHVVYVVSGGRWMVAHPTMAVAPYV